MNLSVIILVSKAKNYIFVFIALLPYFVSILIVCSVHRSRQGEN